MGFIRAVFRTGRRELSGVFRRVTERFVWVSEYIHGLLKIIRGIRITVGIRIASKYILRPSFYVIFYIYKRYNIYFNGLLKYIRGISIKS